uniref:Calpastatin n=1 Tax=Callorhinchus milii TaxID=7868 RepID=A0A4W3JQ56_CALMI
MSQPSKGKPTKDPKKGDAKTGTSAKQGVGTGVEASEVKAKAGHSGKVDTSKAASLASKHSTKPGVTVQKTTDPSKGKPTPKMEPGSKTNPAAKQATSSSSFSGAKPKDTALGKAATVSSTKSSGTTGEKQSHSPIAGSQKGKMVLGKTSDTSKDVKQSRNIHAANANSVRFKEEIHQKHLEDVMKIVADMKSQIMSEVSLMIGEEINSLKGTIIKSLESTSIDQKGAVITTLKNASVIEPKNPKESASVSSTASGSANKSAAQGKSDPSAVSLLADTLLPEDTGPTAPKYTGPNVQEDPRSEKKIKKLGEDERTIPPDYRFEEDPNTKVLTDKALIDPLTFDIKSDASISKSAAPPPSYSQAAASKQKEGKTDAHGAFDELSDMLLPEGPVHSGPKYTGPQIKEKTACEKIADKVGEREDSLPPEYRLLPEATSKKDTSVGTHVHPAEKPKPQIQSDIMDVMALDFAQSSPGLITKSPAPSSHCAAPLQKKDQIEPVKASAAFSVSASQPAPKGKTGDMGALDALSDMLQPEAPVHSGPKYTGPEVKEKAAHEKLADKVGEREDSIPPNYRFSSEGADKKGPAVVAPTDSGKKPELLTKIDPVDAMALDFAQSSPAVITKSAVASSHAAPPMQKQDQIEPVRMSAACSVSASKHDAKGKTGDMGALDALSDMLQPEAPVHSGPKYTGPEVKEKKAHEKLADKVGEREDSLPPDYRFNPEDIAKKGPAVPVSTDTAKKPELLTGTDVLDAMASDFAQSSPAIITQSAVASSHAAPPKQTKDQIEPVKMSAACSVSASQPAPKGTTGDMGALDALSDMLQPEAPVHSGPIYTGPEVKEKTAREKLADKVGEREDSLPPDYRFNPEDIAKKGPAVPVSTDTAKKPELLTNADVLDAMASDFAQSSPAIITQSAVASSHAAPPKQTKDQIEPVKASAACSVSASQPAPKGKNGDMGALDALSDMLQPEAPVHSGPKYTGPEVKEKAAREKLADKVGEREDSLPPDYRFILEGTDKKGSVVGAPTDPVKKPEVDLLDAMASDFIQSSPATITQSAAAQSHSAAPMLKKDQSECEFVKATSASSVSASQSAAQGKIGDMGALDELSDMLQPETPVHSGPKYTGPEVKEKTATEKLANKVGERESSLPPDYRFKPEDTDNKGPAVGAAIDLSKKSKMTETQVMDAMSLDFGQNSETLMSKSQAGGTKQKKMDNKAGGLSIETSPTSPTSPKSPKSPTSPTSPTKAKDTASKSAKVNTNIIKMISSDNALPFIYCPMCELVKKIVYTKWNCRLILWSGLVICRDYI